MKVYIFAFLFFTLALGAEAIAQGTKQTLSASCTTKGTGFDNKRHNCYSPWSKITAPNGFVFSKETIKGGYISKAGSENSCEVKWSEQREVIPGIYQPSVVELRAYALSPKNGQGARGWSACSYEIHLIELPRS